LNEAEHSTGFAMERMERQINAIRSGLKRLGDHHNRQKRELPFRGVGDEYKIWVSEIMLQQTRVSAMLDSYVRFIRRFPDIKTLAAATEEEVLAYWTGLGYYSRARNLHRGACQIVAEYDGRFPGTYEEALKIRGVGEYTAAAVLSLANELPVAVVDGNVIRVVSRWFDLQTAEKKKIRELSDRLMEERLHPPSVHNEALMELGATICTPRSPECEICPLQKTCSSFQKGGKEYAQTIPAITKQKLEPVEMTIQIVTDRSFSRFYLERKRDSYFFKNLWFFPFTLSGKDEGKSPSLKGKKRIDSIRSAFVHHITRHKITVHVELYHIGKEKSFDEEEGRCIVSREEMSNKIVSSLRRKIFQTLAKHGHTT